MLDFFTSKPRHMLMIIGLMDGGLAFCIQSLPQPTNHDIIEPVKEQVTVNPRSGRRERIFINLEAVYPHPEQPGTELSFEELRASSRGWLQKQWKSEKLEILHDFTLEAPKVAEVFHSLPSEVTNDAVLSQEYVERLVIPRDPVMLDENGVVKEAVREGRTKKLKTVEVNETQISMRYPS
jgi:checkpoint serine/threonine-protein kinase